MARMAKETGRTGAAPCKAVDRMKLEIAAELGLADKVRRLGWGGLSAAETGRIGGLLTKRMRAAPPPEQAASR